MSIGNWPQIILLYFCGIVAVSGMAQIPSIEGDIIRDFHVSPAAAGVALSAIFIASAVGSGVGGWLVDRIGAKRTIWGAALIFVAVDLGSYAAPNILWFDAARCLGSVSYLGLVIGCPAIIAAITSGVRQHQAMSVWSTFVSAGWIVGPLLSAAVAGTHSWRNSFLFHAVFAGAATLGCWLLLSGRNAAASTHSIGITPEKVSVLEIFRNVPALHLALAFGCCGFIGIGVNSIFPLYLSAAHQISPRLGSSILSAGSAINLLGGFGYLLASSLLSTRHLALIILSAAVGSAILIFTPWFGLTGLLAGFVVWGAANGLVTALLMTIMPLVAGGPSRVGAVAGLIGQTGAIAAMIGAPIYSTVFQSRVFQSGPGYPLAAISIIACVALVALLPIWSRQNAIVVSISN